MKSRRSFLGMTVTAMLLATSLLLFVMLGGCGEKDPAETQQTTANSIAQTEPWGTVVISPTDDESDPGSIEIILPNDGDGEDGEEGGDNVGGNTGNTGNTSDPTVPTQSGNTGNTQNPRPTDPTLPTQSGDGDTEQGNQSGENNGSVGNEDDEVDLEVDFDDLWN